MEGTIDLFREALRKAGAADAGRPVFASFERFDRLDAPPSCLLSGYWVTSAVEGPFHFEGDDRPVYLPFTFTRPISVEVDWPDSTGIEAIYLASGNGIDLTIPEAGESWRKRPPML